MSTGEIRKLRYVVVAGSVENRESKRLAEEIAESVSGTVNVENRLRVKVRGI
jgi:osmotically-inducible protein OsmY